MPGDLSLMTLVVCIGRRILNQINVSTFCDVCTPLKRYTIIANSWDHALEEFQFRDEPRYKIQIRWDRLSRKVMSPIIDGAALPFAYPCIQNRLLVLMEFLQAIRHLQQLSFSERGSLTLVEEVV